ncbi:hypothetical protein AAFF_G00102700 [Aldrovandia affinis]|uniref:Uncharacterized protein n=1 Tax=Aldrovandia affinis TaxID=143900 RepID=A0AAD7RUE2_9TELE|nr:hypothetical protein AAFF_G00102700 [Aldrovandia affinis]
MAEMDTCEVEIKRKYEVVPAVIFSMYYLFSIIYCFFVIISRRQKRVQLMQIRQKGTKKRQQGSEQPGIYRRKPTPIKRYAGDIHAAFSQSAASYLQDRQMGTATSLSSLGTTNHTLMDFDFETGSTPFPSQPPSSDQGLKEEFRCLT